MMLLIDAANINSGGGESLLIYLIDELEKRSFNYHVITDPRWHNNNIHQDKQTKIKISILNRKIELKRIIQKLKPSTILFFGNFPPPFKCENIRTYTYIQNRFVVNWANSKYISSFKERLYLLLTRIYLGLNVLNSDFYIFQSGIVKDEFAKSYKIKSNRLLVIPFFKIPIFNTNLTDFDKRKSDFIYVSSDLPHKNHLNLMIAWELNYKRGLNNTLFLTIDEDKDTETTRLFKKLKLSNVPIVNLGVISQNEIFHKCLEIKYVIFPSFIETIGLNIIEATILKNKVLTSDLNYVYEVIEPSISFNPFNPHDIAMKVELSLKDEIPFPIQVMENKIDEFINILL